MTTQEIKDLLDNSQWKPDIISHAFVNGKMHGAVGPEGTMEVIEEDGKRYIQFENSRFQIIDATNEKLVLDDAGTSFTLHRVI